MLPGKGGDGGEQRNVVGVLAVGRDRPGKRFLCARKHVQNARTWSKPSAHMKPKPDFCLPSSNVVLKKMTSPVCSVGLPAEGIVRAPTTDSFRAMVHQMLELILATTTANARMHRVGVEVTLEASGNITTRLRNITSRYTALVLGRS